MNELSSYFITYLFTNRTRQRILLIAVIALAVSTFALLVIQSTMGALQKNLMDRSVNIEGELVINLPLQYEQLDSLKELLIKDGASFTTELHSELLVKHKNFVLPIVIHGIDETNFLPAPLAIAKEAKGGKIRDLFISSDLANKLNAYIGDEVEIIAPGHTDELLGEIPRSVTARIDTFISTEVPEIDESHVWTRMTLLQNLLKTRSVNRVSIYSSPDLSRLKERLITFDSNLLLKSWAMRHPSLAYALKLESSIMIFLFVMMTILVAFTVATGLTIFLDKIKRDLTSFWILGASIKTIRASHLKLVILLNLGATFFGALLGTLLLLFISKFGEEMMPDIFVDRSIPVSFSFKIYLFSIGLPFLIGFLFSMITFHFFAHAKERFLYEIRSRAQ